MCVHLTFSYHMICLPLDQWKISSCIAKSWNIWVSEHTSIFIITLPVPSGPKSASEKKKYISIRSNMKSLVKMLHCIEVKNVTPESHENMNNNNTHWFFSNTTVQSGTKYSQNRESNVLIGSSFDIIVYDVDIFWHIVSSKMKRYFFFSPKHDFLPPFLKNY